VSLLLLMPRYDPDALARQVANARAQRHPGCRATLLVDAKDLEERGAEIRRAVEAPGETRAEIRVRPVAFFERDAAGEVRRRRRMGEVFSEVMRGLGGDDWFGFVAPDEELFAEHVQSLCGALEREPAAGVAHADCVYRHRRDGQPDGDVLHDLQGELDYVGFASNKPLGYGRFLFRRSAYADHLHSALPYVDAKAVALLVAACPQRAKSGRASVICDIQSEFNCGFRPDVQAEFEVMRDYVPSILEAVHTDGTAVLQQDRLEPTSLSLKRLPEQERQAIAVDLAHSVPIPKAMEWVLFGPYRLWLWASRRR
jgi:hypothetical protein